MANQLSEEVREMVLRYVMENYGLEKEDVVTIYKGEGRIHVYAHRSGSALNLEFDPKQFNEEKATPSK